MLRFMWDLMRKDKYRYILACFLSIITIPIVLFKSTIGGQLVDEVIVNRNFEKLYPLIGILLAAVVFRSVTKRCSNMMLEDVSQTAVMRLRQQMYFRLSKMDFNYFDKTRTGDILSLIHI